MSTNSGQSLFMAVSLGIAGSLFLIFLMPLLSLGIFQAGFENKQNQLSNVQLFEALEAKQVDGTCDELGGVSHRLERETRCTRSGEFIIAKDHRYRVFRSDGGTSPRLLLITGKDRHSGYVSHSLAGNSDELVMFREALGISPVRASKYPSAS